jgi:hypothetical protein
VIDTQTEPWGIKVTTVEIKDVEIPERMQHAIARQAEAERERRAKIINAEGEAQAAAKLAEAADVIGVNPVTLQLRYLQTLREIGGSQNSTIVFPMPIDLIRSTLDALDRSGGEAMVARTADRAAQIPPAVAAQIPPAVAAQIPPAVTPELGAGETAELNGGGAEAETAPVPATPPTEP